MSRQLRSRLLLAAILAVGLGLRLWGIGFAASTPVGRPDEEIFCVEALAMFVRSYDRLATGWPDLAEFCKAFLELLATAGLPRAAVPS